ncbi:MAG: hypothetical protein IIC12_07685 [Proteobacteria bacterium]|nr:hypothetical protein [Pseudomonadota bacterium]
MRIDGHQHFWTTQRDDYGWLTPDLELLYRDFVPEDLRALLDQAGVDRVFKRHRVASAANSTDPWVLSKRARIFSP